MKNLIRPFFILLSLLFISCDKDDVEVETYEVAVPVTLTIAEFRASVSLEEPREIEESGKIYVYDNYIFVIDNLKGILVIDNTYHIPEKVAYLNIPQNTDIAVKGNVLFANSGMDLVTFDISDINNIAIKERLENVFETSYYPELPEEVLFADFSGYNHSEEVIVGYTMETRERETRGGAYLDVAAFNNTNAESAGTGGSMARFNIAGDHLYVVGENDLSVFDINDLSNPVRVGGEFVGWRIETIFNQEDYLYLGSASGMYIYSIEDPAAPKYMSELQHVLGCDPVVVSGDLAYVTIRGGNLCGQEQSQLEVIDVSNKEAPQLLQTYEMDNPYGLGVRGDMLFVCDGTSGLKVFDASNSPELVLKDHFEDMVAYDVIPLEDVLILIGDNVLRQYSYKNNQINLISTLDLN